MGAFGIYTGIGFTIGLLLHVFQATYQRIKKRRACFDVLQIILLYEFHGDIFHH